MIPVPLDLFCGMHLTKGDLEVLLKHRVELCRNGLTETLINTEELSREPLRSRASFDQMRYRGSTLYDPGPPEQERAVAEVLADLMTPAKLFHLMGGVCDVLGVYQRFNATTFEDNTAAPAPTDEEELDRR